MKRTCRFAWRLTSAIQCNSRSRQGYITDNTQSGFGRRKPYFFIEAVLSGTLFAVLWQLNQDNSRMYNFWNFLILSMIGYVVPAFTAGLAVVLMWKYNLTEARAKVIKDEFVR